LSNEEEIKVIADQKVIHPVENLTPVMDLEEVLKLQKAVKHIEIAPNVLEYIVRLVSVTRNRKEEIKLGASPRASIALMKASCAWALLEGRDYVIPEDVFKLSSWVLKHRITLQPKVSVTGKIAEDVIAELIKNTPIP
jgi:MoxR-like ATPase